MIICEQQKASSELQRYNEFALVSSSNSFVYVCVLFGPRACSFPQEWVEVPLHWSSWKCWKSCTLSVHFVGNEMAPNRSEASWDFQLDQDGWGKWEDGRLYTLVMQIMKWLFIKWRNWEKWKNYCFFTYSEINNRSGGKSAHFNHFLPLTYSEINGP